MQPDLISAAVPGAESRAGPAGRRRAGSPATLCSQSLLARLVIGAGLMTCGFASCSDGKASSAPGASGILVTLIAQQRGSCYELPLQWFSVSASRTKQVIQNPASGPYLEREKISEEILYIKAEDLQATLERWPAVAPRRVSLPSDGRLGLFVEQGSGRSQFRSLPGAAPGERRRLRSLATPWSGTTDRHWSTPPREKRWIVHRGGLEPGMHPRNLPDDPIFPGFGGVLDSGTGYFAAEGSLKEGPGTAQATLCAGRTDAGDLWLWYEREDPRHD